MSEIETMRFSAPAKVLKRAPTEQLLQMARNQHAIDDSVFEEHKPFFWAAEISNNVLDSYNTKMAESSLRNYAEDAQKGVGFQDSHNTYRLSLGRSLSGEFANGVVVADFFTIRGLKFNDATYQTTDDFINAVRAGIAKDVSIGFYGGQHLCSLCNVDMWDWESGCRHYPGDEVIVKDPQTGETLRVEKIFAWITNARLSEVSAVYSGSTPGAMILKAERAIEEGQLTPDRIRLLENRYRIKLPDARAIAVVGISPQEAESMNPPTTKEPTAEERTNQDSSLLETQTRQLAEVISEAPKDKPIVEQVRFLNDEVKRLRPLADDGTAYRASLIEEAHAEGVRAHGTEYAKETYQAVFVASPIETIRKMRDDFARIAKEKFPGGRKTKDEGEELPEVRQTPQVNPAAFRA
jgi:hypothetical protein